MLSLLQPVLVSQWCSHTWVLLLLKQEEVIHYTLELADTVVSLRYDSCITGIELSNLSVFKEKVYDEIKNIEGGLIVKEYPTRSASILTIRNHLEKLTNRGFQPDMIIVDYADLIKPESSSKDEKRHQLETIYEELRGISQIYGCQFGQHRKQIGLG